MMGAELHITHLVLDGALTLTHHDNLHKMITFPSVKEASPDYITGVKVSQLPRVFGCDASKDLLAGHCGWICAFGILYWYARNVFLYKTEDATDDDIWVDHASVLHLERK